MHILVLKVGICNIYLLDVSNVCIVVDTDEVLLVTDKLQELLAGKTNETLSAEQWGVGQSCCARFAFDNNWYRARIVGCIDERRMEVREQYSQLFG